MNDCWRTIRFNVNGESRSLNVPPMKRLLDVLREDLRLTGTKEGCGEGECGSCSVRMNGELVNSCLVPVLQAEGACVQTVEGLAINGELHPLQEAFLALIPAWPRFARVSRATCAGALDSSASSIQ
jgi:carbon-monoxide dehydrogenase small subunit